MNDRKAPKRDPPRREPTTRAAAKPLGVKPAGRTLSDGWVGVILSLLVVLFFREVVVGGKTFVSPDATAPAGFATVGEKSLAHDHVYPQWNPYVFLGMPSFASGPYNPLIFPPDWPIAV